MSALPKVTRELPVRQVQAEPATPAERAAGNAKFAELAAAMGLTPCAPLYPKEGQGK